MDAASFIVESPSIRQKSRAAAGPSNPRSPQRPVTELRLHMAPMRKATEDKPSPTARKRHKPRRSPPREPPPPPPPYCSRSVALAPGRSEPLHGDLPKPGSTVACVAPVPETPPTEPCHKCYVKDESPVMAGGLPVPETSDQSFTVKMPYPSGNGSSPMVARYILRDGPAQPLDQREPHNDITSCIDQVWRICFSNTTSCHTDMFTRY